MKNILFTLFLAFAVSVVNATEKEIIAEVIIENLTDREFTSGELTIINLNKTIEVTKAENFNIRLPEKGKYKFGFTTDDFMAFIYYPARINKRKNTITVRLVEKNALKNGATNSIPMNLETNLTVEQIEVQIAEGNVNFTMNGIDNSIPEEYIKFKEKYGIGLVIENCAIDPLSFKRANENNQMIFDFLNNTYGFDWLNELETKPLGIK